MKNKYAIIFLITGSTFWFLKELYIFINEFLITNFWRLLDNPLQYIFAKFIILVPISFLVFSLSLFYDKDKSLNNEDKKVDELINVNLHNISVKDWLISFLVTMIPIGGIIALFMWSNDDFSIVRRNWAKATVIYNGIVLLILLLLTIYHF